MKTKFLYIVSAVLMTLGFAACSGSEDLPEGPQNNNSGVKKTYTINISLGSAATRTVLDEVVSAQSEWKWNEGDQLVLSDKDGKYVTMLTLKKDYQNPVTGKHVVGVGDNLAVFTGVSDYEIFVGQTYRVTYMGYGMGKSDLDTDAMTFNVDFAGQDGTVGQNGLGKCDVMSETIIFSKTKDDIYYNEAGVTLKKLLSVAHFQIEDPVGLGSATSTAICDDNNKVCKSVTCQINKAAEVPTLINPVYATRTAPLTFAATEAFTSGNVYLTMVPGTDVAPIFKRTYGTGSSKAYGTPGKASTLQAGYIYRVQGSDLKGILVPMAYDSLEQFDQNVQVSDWGNGSVIEQEYTYKPSQPSQN